jgi:hypothetical protein
MYNDYFKKQKSDMNFLKALFGSSDTSAEDVEKESEKKQFDLMKYDGVRAMKMGQFDYAVRCFEEALKVLFVRL